MEYLKRLKLDQEKQVKKIKVKEELTTDKLIAELEEEQKNSQPITLDNVYDQAMSGLIPITSDLIKELRLSGRFSEANELLKAFRRNCIEQKITDEIYLRRMGDQRNKMILHKNGLCTVCAKNKPRNENYKTCDECLIKAYSKKGKQKPLRRKLSEEEKIERIRIEAEKKKERYFKNKSLGICVNCKTKKAEKNHTNCASCIIHIKARRKKLRDKKRLSK